MIAAQSHRLPPMVLHTRAEIDKMLQDESSEFMHWYCDQWGAELDPWEWTREYLIFFRSDDGNPPRAWTEVTSDYYDDADPAIVFRDDAGGCWSAVAGRWQQDDSWEDIYEGILDEIMRRQSLGLY